MECVWKDYVKIFSFEEIYRFFTDALAVVCKEILKRKCRKVVFVYFSMEQFYMFLDKCNISILEIIINKILYLIFHIIINGFFSFSKYFYLFLLNYINKMSDMNRNFVYSYTVNDINILIWTHIEIRSVKSQG